MNDNLTQQLAERAEGFTRQGGTELHIEQVLARAGEIKRGRRMRATILMAACVLAIAVPTVFVAVNHRGSEQPTPAREVKEDSSPLRLAGLKVGTPPRTGYAVGGSWHADGKTVEVAASGTVRAVAPLGARLLVETDTGEGKLQATVVPTPPAFVGQETSWPVEGGLALSENGELAGFVQPDGTPVVVQDDGRVSFDLPRIDDGGALQVVAVGGPDCVLRTEYPGCVAWVASDGKAPKTWQSTSAGEVTRAWPAFRSVTAVADGAWIAGITEAHEDLTTCSAVQRFAGNRPEWTTCDHRFVAFSPDARHLLAVGSVSDGAGDGELAVLDTDTGKVVLDLKTADEGFITQMVWEDDTHVLANMHQGGQWAVVRIGLDGQREYAVEPTPGPDYDGSPFVLPTR